MNAEEVSAKELEDFCEDVSKAVSKAIFPYVKMMLETIFIKSKQKEDEHLNQRSNQLKKYDQGVEHPKAGDSHRFEITLPNQDEWLTPPQGRDEVLGETNQSHVQKNKNENAKVSVNYVNGDQSLIPTWKIQI